MLIDLIPVLLFLAAFKLYGIYVATGVGIVATGLQVLYTRFTKKKYDKQQLFTFAMFLLFGGMTIYFHNPIFIKWKPSIIFWTFGLVFFGSQFIGEKPLAERMMGSLLEGQSQQVPRSVWQRMNLSWSAFFIAMGCLNIYIAYTFSLEAWVNFKVYGIMGLILCFSFFQALCLNRFVDIKK